MAARFTLRRTPGQAGTAQAGAPSANWQSVASSSDGSHLVVAIDGGRIYTSADSGASWTEQAGAPSEYWSSVASSSDGIHLVAVVYYGGQIYTSADSGASWTAQAGAPSEHWSSVASSSDGTHLVVVSYEGPVYTSADSGVSWTAQAGAPSEAWTSVASSSDGTHLVAVGYGGQIRTSADSGTNWTETSAPSKDWESVASSSDGTHLVAFGGGGDAFADSFTVDCQIYASADSGTNWTTQPVAPSANWVSIASSSDGSHLVAVVAGGYIYTSVDFGVSWTAQTGAPSANWNSVASSSDGSHLVAVVYGGQIYTSTDFGGTWIAQSGDLTQNGNPWPRRPTAAISSRWMVMTARFTLRPTSGLVGRGRPGSPSENWQTVASSSDGTHLVAAVNDGYIYTSTDSGTNWTAHNGMDTEIGLLSRPRRTIPIWSRVAPTFTLRPTAGQIGPYRLTFQH